jgi:hypothetical protein
VKPPPLKHVGLYVYSFVFIIFAALVTVVTVNAISLQSAAATLVVFPIVITFIPTFIVLYVLYWRRAKGFLTFDRVCKFYLGKSSVAALF